jgi:hypothetical protein
MRSSSFWPVGALLAAVLLLISPMSVARAETSPELTEQLRIGYSLLQSTLSAESHLKYLGWLRDVEFQSPSPEVGELLKAISEVSVKRAAELPDLRKLSPVATGEPPPSPIGDAIQAAAQSAGTREMLFPDGQFAMRFVFLQAQATRMATVIAQQTAKLDPNPRRSAWLKEVAKEFADLRERLVHSVEGCKPHAE